MNGNQGLYVGYCLDLGLGVQGDTAIEAYLQRVADIARTGDEVGALRLLRRKAHWSLRLKYWLAWLLTRWPRPAGSRARLWAEDHPDPLACH